MRKISIYSQPQDGRFGNFLHILSSTVWIGICLSTVYVHSLMTQITLQIYDPTKKWERYTIHGD
jgi:hypothetical protein